MFFEGVGWWGVARGVGVGVERIMGVTFILLILHLIPSSNILFVWSYAFGLGMPFNKNPIRAYVSLFPVTEVQ